MTETDGSPVDQRLTRAQVEKILERAIELDDASDGLSLNELRRIADDVGISPEAVSRAVELVLAGEEAPTASAPLGGRKTWSIIAALVLGVGLVGGLTGLADETVLTLLLLIPSAVALVQHHREKGSVLGFWAHWFGLCAAYFIAWLLVTQGLLWQDLGALVGVVAASVAAVGGFAVDQARRHELPEESSQSLVGSDSKRLLEGSGDDS